MTAVLGKHTDTEPESESKQQLLSPGVMHSNADRDVTAQRTIARRCEFVLWCGNWRIAKSSILLCLSFDVSRVAPEVQHVIHHLQLDTPAFAYKMPTKHHCSKKHTLM